MIAALKCVRRPKARFCIVGAKARCFLKFLVAPYGCAQGRLMKPCPFKTWLTNPRPVAKNATRTGHPGTQFFRRLLSRALTRSLTRRLKPIVVVNRGASVGIQENTSFSRTC